MSWCTAGIASVPTSAAEWLSRTSKLGAPESPALQVLIFLVSVVTPVCGSRGRGRHVPFLILTWLCPDSATRLASARAPSPLSRTNRQVQGRSHKPASCPHSVDSLEFGPGWGRGFKSSLRPHHTHSLPHLTWCQVLVRRQSGCHPKFLGQEDGASHVCVEQKRQRNKYLFSGFGMFLPANSQPCVGPVHQLPLVAMATSEALGSGVVSLAYQLPGAPLPAWEMSPGAEPWFERGPRGHTLSEHVRLHLFTSPTPLVVGVESWPLWANGFPLDLTSAAAGAVNRPAASWAQSLVAGGSAPALCFPGSAVSQPAGKLAINWRRSRPVTYAD